MKSMQLALIFSLLFCFSSNALIISNDYKDGVTICKENESSRTSEIGKWVSVPNYYDNPEKGQTELYTWTRGKIDPLKKTLVFVSGGPGETAHNSVFKLPNWNIIFFDQRGNTCSRPRSKETYLDPNYYSSQNTARDIEQIRKSYGLKQISVYGVSYGTVPAHLYGHLFPQATRSIVLEGIIDQGGASLIEPVRRMRILQKFFDSLPNYTQDRILQLSSHPQIAGNWFSNVGMMMLYLDHSSESFRQFLDNVIWEDSVAIEILKSFEKSNPEDIEYGFGHVMMGMIGCQELGMNLSEVSFFSVFEDRKLVSDRSNHLRTHYCQSLGLDASEKSRVYRASDFPSKAPVTYFQGVQDGSTGAGNAVRHYKNAAVGFAQLILIRDAGHLPLHGGIASGYEPEDSLQFKLQALELALDGQVLPKSLLEELGSATLLKWVQVIKGKNHL